MLLLEEFKGQRQPVWYLKQLKMPHHNPHQPPHATHTHTPHCTRAQPVSAVSLHWSELHQSLQGGQDCPPLSFQLPPAEPKTPFTEYAHTHTHRERGIVHIVSFHIQEALVNITAFLRLLLVKRAQGYDIANCLDHFCRNGLTICHKWKVKNNNMIYIL